MSAVLCLLISATVKALSGCRLSRSGASVMAINKFFSSCRAPGSWDPLRWWRPRRPHTGLGSGFWKSWAASSASFSDLPSSAELCLFPHLHPTLHHHCTPWRGQQWKFWHPVLSVSGGRGFFNKETPFPHSDVEYLAVCGLNLIFNKLFS